ncbi:MAG: Gfo/Idh/MocA family oxidoreductase [Spirochaetia bacterium]|nr:Gfo/Idh/MocA family oxidoreductase [Spirochaetia bacterium]
MRISIIGTGRIGFSLENDLLRYKPCTHMGAIQLLIKKGIKLKWQHICDIDNEKINNCKKFLYIDKAIKKTDSEPICFTQDYREVLSAKPDILVIAADTSVHYKITIEAIKAGIPRIILEKPISPGYRQSMKIYKQAEKSNTHIWINYERRYHLKYKQLKESIQSGKPYGRPLYYRAWFASSNSSLFKKGLENEGALLHDTTHLVDLALFLFGDVKKFKREISGNYLHKLLFFHNNSISGEILTTINNCFFHFEIEIFFENARIKAGNGFLIVEKAEKSKLYKNFTSLSSPQFIPDKKMLVKDNPFINLYFDVIHDNYETSFLKDACQNIKYLT